MADRVSLSVILATTEPWPDLANCLEVLAPQVAALGGEIVVGDGHGDALDATGTSRFERLSCIRVPGASVFELRARAVERARGDIVALTEDHCLVGRDWCQRIIDALAARPHVMAVTGPVLNGSNDRLIDRANYLHTFASYRPPMNKTQRDRCPPVANVAFRRALIGPGPIPAGRIELDLIPRVFHDGLVCIDDGMTVTHVQSHGFWLTLRAHFDNGRATTGLNPIPFTRRQLPWNVLRCTLGAMSDETRSSPSVRAMLPLVFLLSCCHAAGEAAGILAGPGRSPARLR